jgi:hypothetical protein
LIQNFVTFSIKKNTSLCPACRLFLYWKGLIFVHLCQFFFVQNCKNIKNRHQTKKAIIGKSLSSEKTKKFNNRYKDFRPAGRQDGGQEGRGRCVEQKLMLSASFRCDQNHNNLCFVLDQTILSCLHTSPVANVNAALSYIYIGDITTILCVISQVLSHLVYLPWPIEMILSLLQCPRWPRKYSPVTSPVAVTCSFANKCRQCKCCFRKQNEYFEQKLFL